MEKDKGIFFMKVRSRKESRKASDIMDEIRKTKKETQTKTPQVGPRVKLMHYIKDLNLNVNDAFKKILVEFPDVSKEELITWYREEKEKEGKGGDFFDLSR